MHEKCLFNLFTPFSVEIVENDETEWNNSQNINKIRIIQASLVFLREKLHPLDKPTISFSGDLPLTNFRGIVLFVYHVELYWFGFLYWCFGFLFFFYSSIWTDWFFLFFFFFSLPSILFQTGCFYLWRGSCFSLLFEIYAVLSHFSLHETFEGFILLFLSFIFHRLENVYFYGLRIFLRLWIVFRRLFFLFEGHFSFLKFWRPENGRILFILSFLKLFIDSKLSRIFGISMSHFSKSPIQLSGIGLKISLINLIPLVIILLDSFNHHFGINPPLTKNFNDIDNGSPIPWPLLHRI